MSLPPIEFHSAAVEEARAARRWYEERSRSAARRFIAELDRAILRIQEAPDQWPRFSGSVRQFILHRFPYCVIYRRERSTIQVIAIAHARRRPAYWKNRIK